MLKTYVNYFLSKIKNEKGQGMVEYALIIALVSIAAIVVLGFLGEGIMDTFQQIVDKLSGGGTTDPVEEGFKHLFF